MKKSTLRQKLWLKLFAVCMVLSMALGFSFPGQALASGQNDQIVFSLNGSDAATYTRANLTTNFDHDEQIWSTVNNWPTKKFYVTDGVSLESIINAYLFNKAKTLSDVDLITVTATDNYSKTFTKQELLDDTHYYYPNIMDDPDDPSDSETRDTVIALTSAESDDVEDLTDAEGLRLIMGQRAITEQSNPWMISNIAAINLLTDQTLTQWSAPTASPNPGTVPNDTSVTLSFTNNYKVYYTTDGSTPTLNSAMYNISKTSYQPELNVPIELPDDATTTIKAIAIGPGQLDSNVATFTYTTTP